MAGNGWNGWKWMEMNGDRHIWRWLELLEMVGSKV